ncbi:MAG TPA: hypothetical protein PK777_14645, partial [Thermoguttaceae bacterium]|nr:hypothetical protein [Thermoguttaceae bacterium]
MCFWIWGGALLAGVFCQAAEGIWPRQSGLSGGDPRRLSAAVREAETSGFLPTTTDTSSNRQALQDESSTRRPVPSEHLQGNSASSIVSGSAERSESASGPAGGDGGRGGDIVFKVNQKLNTLSPFQHKVHFKAESGKNGGGKNMSGAAAPTLEIEVPPGTVIKDAETGEPLADLVKRGDTVRIL